MRIISDELFAGLVAHLQKDENVRLFQQLLTSERAEKGEDGGADKEGKEGQWTTQG